MSNQDRMYTTDEVAGILKCKRQTIQDYIAHGKLGCLKFSHKMYRIPQSALDSFLAKAKG